MAHLLWTYGLCPVCDTMVRLYPRWVKDKDGEHLQRPIMWHNAPDKPPSATGCLGSGTIPNKGML